MTPRISTPVKSEEEPKEKEPHEPTKHIENVTKGMNATAGTSTQTSAMGQKPKTSSASPTTITLG